MEWMNLKSLLQKDQKNILISVNQTSDKLDNNKTNDN